MNEDWKTDLTREEKRLALDKVIQLCHANLFSENSNVLKGLYSRGISDSTIKEFKLGAFPEDIGLLSRYVGKKALSKCGIIGFDKEKTVSKFSTHGLIIPVYDEYGEPLAIMGRWTASEEKREKIGIPKYINSFYKKGKTLFGLSHTKESIRNKDKAFIVEGNFDVLTAYQNGMRNVVAASGTFLTKNQVLILSRYASKATLLFDNDEAGHLATENVKKKYRDFEAIDIKASKLPSDVKDLDEYFFKKAKNSTSK